MAVHMSAWTDTLISPKPSKAPLLATAVREAHSFSRKMKSAWHSAQRGPLPSLAG
jgi:hypothetical protein